MAKSIVGACLFFVVLCFSGSSYALDFIKFGTDHDADFWNTPDYEFGSFPSTVQYLSARGKDQITSVVLSDENVQNAFNGNFGSFDAIVVSETIEDLSPGTYALFDLYVAGGGCLIVTASHDDEENFLNSAFGFSIVATDAADGVDTFSLQPDAAGSQFSGGPDGLIAANNTFAYSNTPGIEVYSGSAGAAVFTDTLGAGTLTAIGWDYCCTPPDDPDAILDWYEVINRAFDQCSPVSPARPIPTLSEWGLMAMAGILGMFGLLAAIRRKKFAA